MAHCKKCMSRIEYPCFLRCLANKTAMTAANKFKSLVMIVQGIPTYFPDHKNHNPLAVLHTNTHTQECFNVKGDFVADTENIRNAKRKH